MGQSLSRPETVVQLYLLGSFRLNVGGPRQEVVLKGQRARWLLAYLAVYQDQAHSRVRLAGILWPDLPESRARRALSQAVWQVRRALGPDVIRSVDNRLALGEHVWSDVSAFRAGVVSKELQAALELYRGDFLPDSYDDWTLVAREQLREQYLDGLHRIIGVLKRLGRHQQALAYARQLVRAEPLRERAHQEIMHLYLILNEPARALQQYETLRALLLEELGVEPSAALQALRDTIQSRSDQQSMRPAPLFTTPERLPFVGRREERAALLQVMEQALYGQGGLVLLEGAPGMGKSRLLRELELGGQWRGMAVAYGQATAVSGVYTPLREAIDRALTPACRAALERMLPALVRDAAAHVWPVLGTPLAEARPRQLRSAMAQVIAGIARCAPLLLLLDDVQDADPAVLRVLAEMASQVAQVPLLILLAYRPLEARARPDLWEGLLTLDREYAPLRVTLPPLGTEDRRLLVAAALGTPTTASVVASLAEEAGDAPLHTVEMLRYLHRQRILTRTPEGTWHLKDHTFSLPPTVPALVQSRARRLPHGRCWKPWRSWVSAFR